MDAFQDDEISAALGFERLDLRLGQGALKSPLSKFHMKQAEHVWENSRLEDFKDHYQRVIDELEVAFKENLPKVQREKITET